jgi:hypothetical protein
MTWTVLLHPEFEIELLTFPDVVQDELAVVTRPLKAIGPQLGRPHVDTLKGSKFFNMKELRFSADGGEWRVAFAFDPKRQAIILVAGDKSGVAQKRFYKSLIERADIRFNTHINSLHIMNLKG